MRDLGDGFLAREGQAHVDHFHGAAARQHQVGRFDIAMNQAVIMRVLQANGCLADGFAGEIDGKRAVILDGGLQIDSVDPFHDDETP